MARNDNIRFCDLLAIQKLKELKFQHATYLRIKFVYSLFDIKIQSMTTVKSSRYKFIANLNSSG